MTKEELKQESEEKAKKRTKGFACQGNCEKSYVMGALDFAEPREKRIVELEAQIEKMKRCEICKEYTSGSCNYHSYSQQVCKENGMKLFKLKEIKENDR